MCFGVKDNNMKVNVREVLTEMEEERRKLKEALERDTLRREFRGVGNVDRQLVRTRLGEIEEGLRRIASARAAGQDAKRAVLGWRIEEARRKVNRAAGSGTIVSLGGTFVLGSQKAEKDLDRAKKALERYDAERGLLRRKPRRGPVGSKPRKARRGAKSAGPVGVGRRKPRRK